jgi:thiamine biosynthesis lipoprotein ApbE
LSETSRASYHQLNQHQKETELDMILNYLKKRSPLAYSDSELSRFTGLAKTVVWSRRNTLAQKGLIVYAGTQFDKQTQRYVQTWKYKKQKFKGPDESAAEQERIS